MDKLEELLDFLDELKSYREVLTKTDSKLPEYKLEYEKLLKDKSWADFLAKYPLLQKLRLKISTEESKEELREKLLRKTGVLKDEIAKLIGRTDINQFSRTWNRALSPVFGTGENKDALSLCIDYTLEAIGKLEKEEERLLLESLEKPKNIPTKTSTDLADKPKAFIAHGGKTEARDKLCQFLTALDIIPLIAEEQPSEGRSVAENVDYYARQSDFAIILATKGDIDSKTGGFIPRGNVLMETGKLQEIFKDRIVYLLQAGTKFPTNISEKVRERFTSQNMDNAFIKIAKELNKFGILKAVKPRKEE